MDRWVSWLVLLLLFNLTQGKGTSIKKLPPLDSLKEGWMGIFLINNWPQRVQLSRQAEWAREADKQCSCGGLSFISCTHIPVPWVASLSDGMWQSCKLEKTTSSQSCFWVMVFYHSNRNPNQDSRVCHQAWRPKYNPWEPEDERRESTDSCQIVIWPPQACMYAQKKKKVNLEFSNSS